MDQHIKKIVDEYFVKRKTTGKFLHYDLNKETNDHYEIIGHYQGKSRRYIHKLIVSKSGIILSLVAICIII